jgi:hypothetical protein
MIDSALQQGIGGSGNKQLGLAVFRVLYASRGVQSRPPSQTSKIHDNSLKLSNCCQDRCPFP